MGRLLLFVCVTPKSAIPNPQQADKETKSPLCKSKEPLF